MTTHYVFTVLASTVLCILHDINRSVIATHTVVTKTKNLSVAANSSGMRIHVTVRSVPEVSKERSAFIFDVILTVHRR